MSAMQECLLTALVTFSPILLAMLIGAICWAVRYGKRRKEAMDATWEEIYDDDEY